MKRKLNGDHNQCPTCGEYFNSTKAFDKHRTGAYGGHQRRCLTVPEMLEAGMSKNKTDWWITKARPDAVSDLHRVRTANATEI